MIPAREILELRGEWLLDVGVIEKDYVLSWLLAGIANDPELASTWVFKGGTCLRKCYYETYRLSEDLDFTIVNKGPEAPEDLLPVFTRIASWMREETGIDLIVDDQSFRRRTNLRGNDTTEGRLTYRGPNPPPTLPKVKLDLTSDEVLVEAPETRQIVHPYSDAPLPTAGVLCYSLVELFAEKIRALAQRCRPRDLYDVVHIRRHPDLLDRSAAVLAVLDQKCAYANVPVPSIATIQSSPYREEIEREWENMLGHQLPRPLPPFAEFWESLADLFSWLSGTQVATTLPRAELGELDSAWQAPRAMTSWRRGVPLELIRYAGANRLKVEIDYQAREGRRGPRVVEPYSLRRSKDGNLLLFVVNDRGLLRSYRLDWIAGVRPTDQPFQPRYLVEF